MLWRNHNLVLFLLLVCCCLCYTQLYGQSFKMQHTDFSHADNAPAPVHPLPTQRQLLWQETEFYAFFHYGMNTYTDLEWGMGSESESLFAPTAMPNPYQWVKAAKEAGMKGGIAVVKHHDGFCLWPTKTTQHNVTNAVTAFAKVTNIPKDFSEASKALGMKYGFYVSPWDRKSAHWGKPNYVDDVFLPQCVELAQYGADQFEMWFDGAVGDVGYYGGANERRTINYPRNIYYDIPNLRDSIHKLAPNCVMWGVGEEARWIGNEEGWAGETNWSNEARGFVGERNGMYGTADGWCWFPGEADAKMTNKGWFWHEGEAPLSAERLFQMYLETVGRNATLILNCPPDKSGSLPSATVARLQEVGSLIKSRLQTNDYAKVAITTVGEVRAAGVGRNYDKANLTDDNKDTYWATPDGVTAASIVFQLPEVTPLYYVELMEYIKLGQRVKSFTIETSTNGTDWTKRGGNIATTTIGYKRIIPLNGSTARSYDAPVLAKYVKITINESKACPLISKISIY